MGVALRWLILILVGLVPARMALAHAAPVRLDPPSGALVAPGPLTLRIGMNQAVELRFSQVSVSGPERSWNAELRLEGDQNLAADLPDLAPGRYDIAWRVLSVDGHLTEGTYYVTVSPEGMVHPNQPASAPGARGLVMWVSTLGLALFSGVTVARLLRKSFSRG